MIITHVYVGTITLGLTWEWVREGEQTRQQNDTVHSLHLRSSNDTWFLIKRKGCKTIQIIVSNARCSGYVLRQKSRHELMIRLSRCRLQKPRRRRSRGMPHTHIAGRENTALSVSLSLCVCVCVPSTHAPQRVEGVREKEREICRWRRRRRKEEEDDDGISVDVSLAGYTCVSLWARAFNFVLFLGDFRRKEGSRWKIGLRV